VKSKELKPLFTVTGNESDAAIISRMREDNIQITSLMRTLIREYAAKYGYNKPPKEFAHKKRTIKGAKTSMGHI
jgi:hypothetical protein